MSKKPSPFETRSVDENVIPAMGHLNDASGTLLRVMARKQDPGSLLSWGDVENALVAAERAVRYLKAARRSYKRVAAG